MLNVFHASILPWTLASQAPVLHVGTYGQANTVFSDYEYACQTTLYFYISEHMNGSNDITSVRVLHNSCEFYSLYIVLESHIFDTVLTDTEANTAHTLHAHEFGYPLSSSVYNSADLSLSHTEVVVDAVDALKRNILIPYINTSEGPSRGLSYIVPNPQSNLILRGVSSVRPLPDYPDDLVRERKEGGRSVLEKSLGRTLDVRLTRGKS
jgi:hypothetical protein